MTYKKKRGGNRSRNLKERAKKTLDKVNETVSKLEEMGIYRSTKLVPRDDITMKKKAIDETTTDVSREDVLRHVRHNGLALQNVPEDLQDNKTIVLSAVKQNGLALQYASEKLRDDTYIVLSAVKQNGMALQYASEDLRKYSTTAHQAVKQNPDALQYYSPRTEDSESNAFMKDLVKIAVLKNPLTFQYAPSVLKKDEEFITDLLQSLPDRNKSILIPYIPKDTLKENITDYLSIK